MCDLSTNILSPIKSEINFDQLVSPNSKKTKIS